MTCLCRLDLPKYERQFQGPVKSIRVARSREHFTTYRSEVEICGFKKQNPIIHFLWHLKNPSIIQYSCATHLLFPGNYHIPTLCNQNFLNRFYAQIPELVSKLWAELSNSKTRKNLFSREVEFCAPRLQLMRASTPTHSKRAPHALSYILRLP